MRHHAGLQRAAPSAPQRSAAGSSLGPSARERSVTPVPHAPLPLPSWQPWQPPGMLSLIAYRREIADQVAFPAPTNYHMREARKDPRLVAATASFPLMRW
jgi:hypothetical protein